MAVVVIVWQLDFQLPMQSVLYLSPLMLRIRISITARCTALCDKVYQWLATGRQFSPGLPGSSANKTDLHDIAEIVLKVALNTNKQTPIWRMQQSGIGRLVLIYTKQYVLRFPMQRQKNQKNIHYLQPKLQTQLYESVIKHITT